MLRYARSFAPGDERNHHRLPGQSKHRHLNRPAIGEQRDRFIIRLREMAAEFPQQLRLGSRCSTCAGDRPSGYRRVESEDQYWLDELNAPQYATLLV
jgi:hypothetical protein